MENQEQESPSSSTSALGCLLPVFWMLFGNGILALCALAIAQSRTGWPIVADIFYWLTVAGLLGARYADVRHYNGRTAEGRPATMAHWKRYAAVVAAVSVVLWIAVHAFRHFSG